MTGTPQDQDEVDAEREEPTKMLYTLEDRPPWLITILLGLQVGDSWPYFTYYM